MSYASLPVGGPRTRRSVAPRIFPCRTMLASLLEVPLQIGELGSIDQNLDDCPLGHARVVLEPKLAFQRLQLTLSRVGQVKARPALGFIAHSPEIVTDRGYPLESVIRYSGRSFPFIYERKEIRGMEIMKIQAAAILEPGRHRIATYRRVSSVSQTGDNRYGLDKQQADLDAFVAANDHEVVARFEDLGASGAGKTLNRPGLLALLAASASGAFEAVLVPSWDRLARDHVLDGYVRYTLAQHGVTMLSATQSNDVSPEALFTQAILAAVAALERPILRAKLLGARYTKRARGGYIGGTALYGTFAKAGSKVLHRNESEFAILHDMKAMRDGGATLQQIADAMNAADRRARNGGIWRVGTVQSALRGYERAAGIATEAAG